MLSKRRREEARQAAQPVKPETKKEDKSGAKKPAKKNTVDLDPEGLALVQIENPLDMCVKHLQKLDVFARSNLAVQHVGVDVWIRRNKPLRALMCAKRAVKMNSTHPSTHRCLVRLLLMRAFFFCRHAFMTSVCVQCASVVLTSLQPFLQSLTWSWLNIFLECPIPKKSIFVFWLRIPTLLLTVLLVSLFFSMQNMKSPPSLASC